MINKNEKKAEWRFIDDAGTFEWKNPHTINELYFPICNEAGMMSSITPRLNGDAKTGLNSFFSLPVSMEDLHNNRSSRNFWIYSEKSGAYSLTGNSAKQIANRFTNGDKVETQITGAFLAHTLVREDAQEGIKSEITSFCPATDDQVELMWVKITNISDEALMITPTTAIPVFGRSADNIRDHRHATSMMHRMSLYDYGMSVKPTIHHDERGHEPNLTSYFVLAVEGTGQKPAGQFPTVVEFIGDGGSFDWPEAVVTNKKVYTDAPNRRDGMEAIGAIRFNEAKLSPGESREYIVISGVTDDEEEILRCIERYGSSEKISLALQANHDFWKNQVQAITFKSGNEDFDRWMQWIALQPTLRKIYGCSFLPHHDYGRGGRGWRDLWQDYLALILQNPAETRDILVANFGGVRLDGSNATIILKGKGNFAADRNKISRVWMDHGVWPYFTTKLYIDQTGDIDILFEENTYWKDHQIKRAKARDHEWTPAQGNAQKNRAGETYTGSVFEHILLQHLVCFYNVGDFNNMKLEDADWNDQLDMATEKGETVPFTAFYGWNLISMAELLLKYKELKHVDTVKLFKELLILASPLEEDVPALKRERLDQYFDAISYGFSGEWVEVSIDELAADLKRKGEQVLNHIRKEEWIDSATGSGFFNGYYNNDGQRVDGDHEDGTRMNLTAQTFAIMSGAATEDQVAKAYEAANALLKDPNTGGYRLTTPLGPNTWNFGRGFALIYGEKETGGMFSHMAVMFTNALYQRGFTEEAFEVLSNIYSLCTDTKKSKIYPGIPEYVNHEGQGKYHYVTGSASWLLMTMLTQVFGVRGDLGDLVLAPKLASAQFDIEGHASVKTAFAGKQLEITYINQSFLEAGQYCIREVRINGSKVEIQSNQSYVKLKQSDITQLCSNSVNTVTVELEQKF
ncbi:cellobiose phosphorylase [Paenibacillus sp. HN-1]|uniref:GH36-type glycosyl hydrolase domain-containing protein n=1 Tax=Paenibacillus TaxID=44249 RepID=UPI001CA855C0|nr:MULTISPECIES: cellobiose phosphorylase [Paenibacillus]MBY9078342.1 cellobiose phosphorylase [Paenibacillus sp. CGMCC 1.18879]MBY9083154.1 cellobiose phosphorylase [Paenibacillus sinensis]